MPPIRTLFLPIFAILAIFFSGCEIFRPVGSFVAQRYTNAIAYFNTYYNTAKAFSDGENEVAAARKAALSKTFPLKNFQTPSTAKQKFTIAIEKGSKLLSYYPDTKWVDNVLLMIGKSYYYQEDVLRAERKFLEMIAKFPESPLVPETKLWYGKSVLQQRRIEEGLKVLEDLYQTELASGDEEIAGLAALAIGDYYFNKKEYQKSADAYRRGIGICGNADAASESQLLIGFAYFETGDYQNAEKSFRDVGEYNPPYTILFESQLQTCKMISILGRNEEAMTMLEDLLGDGKNAEYAGRIQLETANVLWRLGNADDAINKFVFIDTTYARTEEAARAYYALAAIHDTVKGDFVLAKLNYEKAKQEYSGSEITVSASLKAEALTKYFQFSSEISRCDSTIRWMELPAAVKDSLRRLADTLSRTDSVLIRKSTDSSSVSKLAVPVLQTDSVPKIAAVLGSPLQDSLTAKIKKEKVIPKVQSEAEVKDSLARLDSLNLHVLLLKKKKEKRIIDSLSYMRTKTKNELAGIFHLDLGRPDSALFYYRQVIASDTTEELSPRALFTVAEIFRLKKSAPSVIDSCYSLIIDKFPRSAYAQESRRMLGIPLLKAENEPAEDLYLKAESLMTKSTAEQALNLLREIGGKFQKSPFAPKALLAVGWMYENIICNYDSAAAVYRRVLKEYPGTPYAVKVQPKIDAVDQAKKEEEEKKKKEEEDKKKEKERKIAVADSIRSASERKKAAADSISAAALLPRQKTVVQDTASMRDSTVLHDSTMIRHSGALKDSTVYQDSTVVRDSTLTNGTSIFRDSTNIKDSSIIKDSSSSSREPLFPPQKDSSRTIFAPDSLQDRRN